MDINLTDQIAGVRIFHAANIVEPVNIYVKDSLVIEGLKYSEVTNYLPIQIGKNNIKIRNTKTGKLLYNQTLNIEGNKFITISAIAETGKVDLIILEDVLEKREDMFMPQMGDLDQEQMNPTFAMPQGFYQQPMMVQTPQQPWMYQMPQQPMVGPMCPNPMYQVPQQPMMNPMYPTPQQPIPFEKPQTACLTCNERVDEELFNDMEELPTPPILGNSARLRFVHLSANAPAVDIELANGTRLFTDTQYKQVTNYIPIGAGSINLNVLRYNTSQVVLNIPNIVLLPNESYSLYAIGLLNGNPGFEVVLLRDGI